MHRLNKSFPTQAVGLVAGFLFLSLLPFANPAKAQELSAVSGSYLYEVKRRPDISWQQLETPHFSILHPAHADGQARRTGRILEAQYDQARQLVGGQLQDFPVILNPRNDQSNGLVSPINFRMEVELHPIQGKVLNPRSGNWLETVLPHELIHALQLSNHNRVGLTRLIYPFSPDFARSVHTAIPLGVLEGLAVHHETESVLPSGGRGQYPYFTGLFQSTFSTDQQWSMGQLVHISSQTRPFNRHYVGGHEFTNWLQNTYGPSTSREAISFYSRYPFLGYGTALRHTTGQWPGQLYDTFIEDYRKQPTSRNTTSKVAQSSSFHILPVSYKGAEVRRPLWLSNSELLFYGDFYNGRPGFYRYNLNTRNSRRIFETRLVEDYRYDLSAQRDSLVFARYHAHLFYDQLYDSRIHRISLSDPRARTSSKVDGFAPAYGDNQSLWSIASHKSSTVLQLHSRKESVGDPIRTLRIDSTKIVAVQPHPTHPETLAIIANRRGIQGLWITPEDAINQTLANPPQIAFRDGSVFDPSWHPDGRHLLFSSDYSGQLQLYEYAIRSNQVRQITDHQTNAFEASYSPSGQQIAYILQDQNQKRPAILAQNDFLDRMIPRNQWQTDPALPQKLRRPFVGDSLLRTSRQWHSRSYQTGLDWIKPRTVVPLYDSETDEVGMELYSASLLQNQKYRMQLTHGYDRFWYDLHYLHVGFFPGLDVQHTRQPLLVPSSDSLSFIEWRQYKAEIPLTFTFERNVRQSGFHINPGLSVNRYRAFDDRRDPLGSFSSYLTSRLSSTFYYRLQQNIRDIQPNSGIQLFSELKYDLHRWNASSLRRGIRTGAYLYLAPLRKLNQSLRLGSEWIFQSRSGPFSSSILGMEGFRTSLFSDTPRAFEFNTRYTIPLFYPDDGGFLVPLYLSRIYLVGFSNTVSRMESQFPSDTRTRYGGGVRFTFRLSNLTIDLGVALTVEPTRDQFDVLIGTF